MKSFQTLCCSPRKALVGMGFALFTGGAWAQVLETTSEARPLAVSNREDLGLRFESSAPPAQKALSHKVYVRMGGGMISNAGTLSGSTITYGGSNVGGAFFLNEVLAIGAAYRIESNFSRVPLKGWDLFGRVYYLGAGTVVSVSNGLGDHLIRHRTWSPYAGLEFSSRAYALILDETAIDPLDQSLVGSISAANMIVGVDHRLSRHWEANLEISYTLLPFGGADTRVKIKWMLVSLGMNYVF
jgi:hypothetical protein